MTTILIIGIPLLIVSAIVTFLLGRLAVFVNSLQGLALKALLYIAVTLAGMLVVIAPGIIVALSYFDDLPPLPMTLYPTNVTVPSVLIGYFVYWAVIYLSFRAGIGRVHGTG